MAAAHLASPPPTALRFRLLKHTRLNVVAFLNELPKTQHDVSSFVVDISAQTVSTYVFLGRRAELGKGRLRGREDSGSGWEPTWYLMLLLLFQSTLLCFSVNGVFKEGEGLWSAEFAEWSPSQLVVLSTLSFPATFSSLFFLDLLLSFCPPSLPSPPVFSCLGYGQSLRIRRTQTLESGRSELPSQLWSSVSVGSLHYLCARVFICERKGVSNSHLTVLW